jgi:hypothetical protein
MDVNGQVHVSAVLLSGKEPPVYIESEAVHEADIRSGSFGEAKVSFPNRESKPGCLS